MNNSLFDFGMIGLGTMGRNLLLNIADHGFAVIGYDRDPQKQALLESSATNGTRVRAATSLSEMVEQLSQPRKIMLLVPAGPVVDSVISELKPLLSAGDIIIDGGNSHFPDTLRRIAYLKDQQFHFIGMGVSGGEDGARRGPSIMPGGDIEAWKILKPILEAIAAKVDNEPCVAYMGKDAAGHYVKMVHNGIEYAIMQLISEVYDLLKHGAGLTNDELHVVFSKWNEGELQSFLIEISSAIFLQADTFSGNRLLDMILDKAGSKGTGKWTSQEAMDLGIPVPSIDMAVTMRDLSARIAERSAAAVLYKTPDRKIAPDKEKLVKDAGDALFCATLLCYVQGLNMLQQASSEKQMQIPMPDVVKIWRGGCIIRSSMLTLFSNAYKKQPTLSNLLLDKKIAAVVRRKQASLRKFIKISVSNRIPTAGHSSALAYLDALLAKRLPINLIQAQRDLFGAHGYQRTDREGNFHSEWETADVPTN